MLPASQTQNHAPGHLPPPSQSRPVRVPRDAGLRRAMRRWLRVMLVGLAAVVVAGNLGSLNRYFDLLSNIPVQSLWASLAITGGLLWARSWKCAAAAAVCVLICGLHVVPWYLPRHLAPAAMAAPPTGASEQRLRVMLHNVWQPNTQYQQMIAHVREVDPDLVVFQEVDERWYARLAELERDYPYTFHSPGGRLRGMAVFSRLPLHNVREVAFNNMLSPSIVCDVEAGATRLALICTHPWPPIGVEMTESRNHQLRLTGDFAGELRDSGRSVMIIGDLNTGMWSPHYKDFERRSGLTNVRRGFGILATHPMNEPLYPRVPIDHVLVSDDIEVADVARGEACGSDHAALFADLIVR